ncbi:Protein R02F2.9 [Aphelenchoides avenae]|nr:Protein R02F2.9 [Aphelenchus avenae]
MLSRLGIREVAKCCIKNRPPARIVQFTTTTNQKDESPLRSADDSAAIGPKFRGIIPTDRIKKSFSLSSGPGGQHVNKVATKAEIRFNVEDADWIPETVREVLERKYARHMNSRREFILVSQATRSQVQNLEDCFDKLRAALDDCCRSLAEGPRDPNEDDSSILKQRQEKAAYFRKLDKLRHSMKKRDRSQNF